MCVQYDPTITPRSTSKYPNNPVAEMETIMQTYQPADYDEKSL